MVVVSVEDAHAARTHKQAHDDEQDAPQQLAAKDRDDPRDDEYDSDDPENEIHVMPPRQAGSMPVAGDRAGEQCGRAAVTPAEVQMTRVPK
jgi:hypothetical protein